MTKIKAIFASLVLLFTTAVSVSAQDWLKVQLTEQDEKLRLEYRYRVSVYTNEWNETKKSYDVRESVYYAQHWEVDETKKYSSLEQNYLEGSTLYLTEKNLHVKMPTAMYFNEKGERQVCHCSSSLGNDFGKVIIVDLNEHRVVWRNYDWGPF